MAKTRPKTKAHNLVFLNRDRGYRFRDRDPQMVELCSLIHDSEMDVMEICREVYRVSRGVYSIGNSTIYNWLNGKTRRPQNMTLNWVAFAIGYERKWTKIR
jgi:IS30 family transposase